MPTGTPWVPHWDKSDFEPVNGNMPPTTIGVDACALAAAELADARVTLAIDTAVASATPIPALRRHLAFHIPNPPMGSAFSPVGTSHRGDLSRVRPAQE